VNRWPHGYTYSYNPLFDPEAWAYTTTAERPNVIARQRRGRIAIANADAAASPHTDAAINEAFRAVEELLPGDTAVLRGISGSLKRLSRAKEFLTVARHWQSLDPESPSVQVELMFALDANGLYDEEIALGEKTVRKFPEDESLAYHLAALKLDQRGDVGAMLDYGRRFTTRSEFIGYSKVAIARFVSGDVDGALAVRAERGSDNALNSAIFDGEQAELLRVAGRAVEARTLAGRALATTRAAIAQGRPAPSGMTAAWYAAAASIAALAGDRATAMDWEHKARTSPVAGPDEQQLLHRNLAKLYRGLGDPEAAWREASQLIGPQMEHSDGELLAFKAYYDKLYGPSPSYRAYMARIAAAKGGSP